MVTEKSREARLRRTAERRGLRLEKSRRRDPRAIDYGRMRLIDARTNSLQAELADLDEVEEWLSR